MKIRNDNDLENIKFLKLFNIKINNIKLENKKLGKKLIFMHFINCNIFIIQLILDYIFTKSTCIICPIFNFCLFTPLNFVSLFFLIKSFIKVKNKYKYIKLSNLCIAYSFYFHFFLLFFNIIFGYYFSSIDLFYIYKTKNKCCYRDIGIKKFISFTFPNILYLFLEIYIAYLSYLYTKIESIKNEYIAIKDNPDDNLNNNNNKVIIDSDE